MIIAPSPNRTIPPIQSKMQADIYADVPTPTLPVRPKKAKPLSRKPPAPRIQKNI